MSQDRRKIDDWCAEFVKALHTSPALPAVFQNPVDWQAEIGKWQEIVDRAPPRRTEPIKLTPGQWAILPHGTPTPYPLYQPLGELMGIPVVMVADEAESTPVVEGWLKPKRKRRWVAAPVVVATGGQMSDTVKVEILARVDGTEVFLLGDGECTRYDFERQIAVVLRAAADEMERSGEAT